MGALQEENKQIVVRFNKEFLEADDESVFDETVSPDLVNHSALGGAPGTAEGARHFFQRVLRPAFPDLKVTVHDQIAEGPTVVTRKSYTGTHHGEFIGVPATGRRVEFTVIDIIRLEDGKYVEHWAVPDLFDLRRQLTS